MSRDLVLTADAVALLLELVEQDDAIISAGAADMRAGAVVVLENVGFLTPHEEVLAVTDITDHEDVPVALTWSHEKGALTYFSPSGAMVRIPKERVQTRRVEFGPVLKAIAGDWDVPDRRPPFALAGDFLWEIPDARLGRRPRMPIWFARRLWSRDTRQQIVEATQARPGPMPRVIITSTATARIGDLDIPGAVVVPMAEVLSRPDSLLITALMLDARIKGISVTSPRGPLALTQDGRLLIIRDGPEIAFRAPGQIAIIKKLVEGYPRGHRYRGAELLKLAGSEVGSLQRLFGTKKWRELSPYLNQVDSRWGFDL